MPMLTLLECGLSTAFASGVHATQVAIVEEISVLFRYETFIGSDFQPQLCAFRDNSRIGQFAPRLRELVQEATADLVARISALDAISSDLYGRRAKLVIVLPEIDDASGLDRISLSSLGRDLIDEMCSSLSNDIGLIISETVIRAAGHAGVGSAVADHLIEPSPEHADIVLVAAVDSYSDRQRLNRLNDQKLLFTKQNQFGFVPGEEPVFFCSRGRRPRRHLCRSSERDIWWNPSRKIKRLTVSLPPSAKLRLQPLKWP